MPRKRNPSPVEFRDQLVALARSGRSVESLAREFEPCVATIHGWIKQVERDEDVRDDGLTSAECEELRNQRRRRTMMGQQTRGQERLFYEFRLDEVVPQDHLVRRIDAGLVGGNSFVVDASLIQADANKQRSVPGAD